MIEKIATDVSNILNSSTPTRDFEELVVPGAVPGAHMEKWNYFFFECLRGSEHVSLYSYGEICII